MTTFPEFDEVLRAVKVLQLTSLLKPDRNLL
jgi:hypothetical protein